MSNNLSFTLDRISHFLIFGKPCTLNRHWSRLNYLQNNDYMKNNKEVDRNSYVHPEAHYI